VRRSAPAISKRITLRFPPDNCGRSVSEQALEQLIATTEQLAEEPLERFLRADDPAVALAAYIENYGGSQLPVTLWLSRQIALIDELIGEQLNRILHHPRLQQLESSWRGLFALAEEASPYDNIRIRLLDISWREICKDLDRAAEFDQSQLFNLIYNGEFGSPGGQPFGVLLGDYAVAHRPYPGHPYDDVDTLRGLTQIAAAAFAPLVVAAAPQLFGIDDFAELSPTINFDSIFRQEEYLKWRALRALEDARFLAVTLPGVLLRQPYRTARFNTLGLHFSEQFDHPDGRGYLWGNSAFALGTILIREFGEVGWFAHIRGMPRDHLGGGLVTGFAALPQAAAGGQRYHILTPALITDNMERQLAELGLMSLCHCYETPFAAFHSNPSLQQPKQLNDKAANANARISAMLQQILCASRFAHFIKVLIRDKVGAFITEKDCERYLHDWLEQYTTGRDDLSWEMRARYPLRSARVQVRELPGKPGSYSCVIHLQPHYVTDQLVSELKLATELTNAAFGTGG
jgi:type VI secretion system protein ImpD